MKRRLDREYPTLRRLWGLVAMLQFATTAMVAQAGVDPGPWPMFHRAPDHTGFTALAAPSTNNLSWTAALSDTVEFSSPAVTSFGRIYLGDAGKELWAFDLAGGERWHYHTGGNLRYGSPAVGQDGTIYIGSADGILYALRIDGTPRWTSPTVGPIKTSPAIAVDGTIYAGSDDGRLYAFDATDGHTIWSYPTSDTVRSSPAIGPDGTIYFGSNDGILRALYPNGSLRWVGATGGAIKSAPAVYHDRVIFGSGDGFLYSVDRSTGQLGWATYTGHNLRSSPAIGITGKIYLGMGNNIACFHDDGDPCWQFPTGGRVFSSPAVTAGIDSIDVVLCGSDDGNVYALYGGALLWSASIGVPIRSSPAIGVNGFAYVGAFDGRLYAFGATSPAAVIPVGPIAQTRLVLGPNPALSGEEVRIRLIAPAAGGLGDGADAGSVAIYDPSGRALGTLDLSQDRSAIWDGRDAEGRPVPAGIYLTRWTDGTDRATGRVVRVR